MKLRYKIGLVLVILGITFGLGRCKRTETSGPKSSVPAVLPSSDIEQLLVDPETHQLTILTKTGTQTVILPDRTSTIDVLKGGVVKVTSPQMGLEHHLFVGVTASDHVRLATGIDGFYYKKLDIGIGIADQAGMYTPVAFVKATYNIKGNMQLGIVYQSNQYIGGVLAVRVF